MTIDALIRFVNQHEPAQVEQAFSLWCPGAENHPPYLVVSSIVASPRGVYRESEVIPATRSHVRAWLGY